MPAQLAAYQLGLHAMARDVQRLHAELGSACPREVENLAASAMWMRGMCWRERLLVGGCW